MKNFITYSLIVLMSLLVSQTLFSNNLENKAGEEKIVTTQFIDKVYPNPAFKGNTIFVNLQLKQTSIVKLVVLDMIGNKLIDMEEQLEAGKQNIHFHTDKLIEGVYFVNVINGENKHVQRLIIR